MTEPVSMVYVCHAVDTATQQCTAGEWVNFYNFAAHLPTVEQANTVGWTMFASIAILASLLLLKPQKETEG